MHSIFGPRLSLASFAPQGPETCPSWFAVSGYAFDPSWTTLPFTPFVATVGRVNQSTVLPSGASRQPSLFMAVDKVPTEAVGP